MKPQLSSGLLLVLSIVGTSAGAQQAGPVNGNAEAGAQLYYDHGCYACHGYSGFGRVDLNNTGSPWLATEDVFRAFLRARADVAPILPSTAMPNYPENALSDNMVQDIYAYIRSLPDARPQTDDVPTLRKILEAARERQYQP